MQDNTGPLEETSSTTGQVTPPDEPEQHSAISDYDIDMPPASSLEGQNFVWQSSQRQTIRFLPSPVEGIRVLLGSNGLTDAEVLPLLPYESARRRTPVEPAGLPDPRRLRALREVAQTIGLLYNNGGRTYVTDLGIAVERILPSLTDQNWLVLGNHAAFALAACQLRNPTRHGMRYPPGTEVFPFAYIWRAMLALDGRISSDELNRAILRTHDLGSLEDAIYRIRRRRDLDGPDLDLGEETVTGSAKNDRIIPWVSLASFGWMFITPKGSDPYYRLREGAARLLAGASRAMGPHREFDSAADYSRHISDSACLPKDVR